MSRQLDLEQEVRETARRVDLVKALEFGIAGALASQGFTLLGFTINHEELDCFMVVKASIDQRRVVSFVYSDTAVNCILKAYHKARSNTLKWGKDKYYPSGS